MCRFGQTMGMGMIIIVFLCGISGPAFSSPPRKNMKSKFYNFSEQLIDGQIRKPTVLYTNGRERVKFGRLLKLKKSFLPRLFATARHPVFK